MANILGLFGVTDYDVARRMTLEEYNLRLQGYIVQTVEKEHFAFVSAFAYRAAMATTDKGKPLYKSMTDVFDKDKRREELLQNRKVPINQKLVKIAKNLQKFRKEVIDEF